MATSSQETRVLDLPGSRLFCQLSAPLRTRFPLACHAQAWFLARGV
jgi:hypothetical protein